MGKKRIKSICRRMSSHIRAEKALLRGGLRLFNRIELPLKGTIDFSFFSTKIRGNYIYNGGDNNTVVIGNNSRLLKSELHLSGSNNQLVIGDNVVIRNAVIRLADDYSCISIGESFTCGRGMELYAFEGSSIQIGEKCLFANNVRVRSSDGHAIFNVDNNERIRTANDIVIGDHVWVGDDAYVLKGAKILDGSIIGCCSVVTSGKYEENSVYAGNPCRKVRERIFWTLERQ